MIKFKCDFCDQRLGVPDDFIGKRVRCTKCRAVNIVPTHEERIAKDEARTAAALPAAMKATLPSAAPPKADKVALQSALLDMSSPSSSGSFGGELPAVSESEVIDAKIFDSKVPLPAFGGEHTGPIHAPDALFLEDIDDVSPDDSVVGLADTGSGMAPPDLSEPPPEEELSFDLDPPAPKAPPQDDMKAGHAAGKPKAQPQAAPKQPESEDDEGFGLDLLEPDPTDSAGGSGKLDLDGLGF